MSAKYDSPQRSTVEALESRQLLSAVVTPMRPARPSQITSAYLDNRGQATFTVSVALNTATLSRKTAAFYTAGNDGVFGTADDARMYTSVSYRKGRLTLSAATAVGQKYRVKLNAAVIKDVNGKFLDGDFKGYGVPSGNGVAGGNYDVVTNPAAKTTARFSTAAGYMNVRLLTKQAPKYGANFVRYANAAFWDNTFFHRSVPGFIIQGGRYRVTGAETIADPTANAPVQNEPGISNTRGTVSMAKLPGDPDSATKEFFFNLADNSSNLDNQNEGFTVFGQVTDAAGLATMDAIASFPQVNAGGAMTNLPVRDAQAVINRGKLNYLTDTMLIQRIAMLMDPTATPGTSAVKRGATATAAAPAVRAAAFSAVKVAKKNSVLDETSL